MNFVNGLAFKTKDKVIKLKSNKLTSQELYNFTSTKKYWYINNIINKEFY